MNNMQSVLQVILNIVLLVAVLYVIYLIVQSIQRCSENNKEKMSIYPVSRLPYGAPDKCRKIESQMHYDVNTGRYTPAQAQQYWKSVPVCRNYKLIL